MLTAAHVIKASIDDDSIPIFISHKNFASTMFRAHHVRNKLDVALVKLDDAIPFVELAILDIGLDLPVSLDDLAVL